MTSPQTMATDSQPTLTPKLRFPEFRNGEGWTTQTLGSLASLSTEKVGDKNCIPMSITSGVGLVSQQEKFGRTIAGSSYKNYLQLTKNDFAYNKSATKEFPQGFIALYSGDELAAVPNSIFTCFRINGESPDPKYLNYLFLGNLHGRWLKKYIEVSARAHGSLSIDDEDLFALPVPVPSGESSLAEQQKIAECLSTLDGLIGAESQKLETLKAHKKGLMQQLFPREGETLPRVRFPEFQDVPEWDQGTTNDIAVVLQGYGFPERHQGRQTGELPFYKVSDISRTLDAGSHYIDKAAHYIDHQTLKELKAKTVPEGTTIFAKIGEALRLNKRVITTKPCVIDNNTAGVKAIEGKTTDLFLYYLWLMVALEDHAGGVVPAVNKSSIESIAITYPSPPEQKKIASCLSSLDGLIAAQSDKLEGLKAHKKGLMQQLLPFPVAAEV